MGSLDAKQSQLNKTQINRIALGVLTQNTTIYIFTSNENFIFSFTVQPSL
jgi:hypothetical protein